MSPSTRTAALPPQPFPFLGCWATGGLAPGFGFVGAGGGDAGLAGAAEAFAGAGAGLREGGGGGAPRRGGAWEAAATSSSPRSSECWLPFPQLRSRRSARTRSRRPQTARSLLAPAAPPLSPDLRR